MSNKLFNSNLWLTFGILQMIENEMEKFTAPNICKKQHIYSINFLGNFKILAKAKNRHKFMCELKVMAKKWKYRNMVIASKGKKIRFLILLFF